MSSQPPLAVETDPRFPSGRWLGFFLDARVPGRHEMELDLTFHDEVLTGEGRDVVGEFTFRGRYELEEGKCRWTKQYVGRHSVEYRGFNEGKGIWGTWELRFQGWRATGGFHIWPEGMADPTGGQLDEEADPPLAWDDADDESLFGELEPAAAPQTANNKR
jgi:hypothetical protein